MNRKEFLLSTTNGAPTLADRAATERFIKIVLEFQKQMLERVSSLEARVAKIEAYLAEEGDEFTSEPATPAN